MNDFRSLLLVLAALGACGGSEPGPSSANPPAAASQEERLLRLPVSHAAGDPAEVLVQGTWRSLEGSQPATGARAIRAQGRGSVVNIGDTSVWLRTGAHMMLSESVDGQLRAALHDGQARIVSKGGAQLIRAGVVVPLVSDDVLLSTAGARTVMLATDERPALAHWSLELDEKAELRGVGTMEVKESAQSALELRKLSVSVTIEGGMAVTEVEHIFYNADDEMREGTFRFPAPDDVLVTGLAMEIGGRLMEGEFVERTKARNVYEKIVDEMQDPALLEWQQGGWFKLRVFPIEAKREKRVVLRYAAPLTPAIEGYEYRYLATPPEQNPVGHFSLRLDGKLVVESTDMRSTRDVVLAFPESSVPKSVSESRGEFSYRAITLRLKLSAASSPASKSREVVVALDSSRSALENRDLSLELLSLVLDELGPEDRFAVFSHDIEARELTSKMVSATKDNVREAIVFARSLEFDGASDLSATLEHAQRLATTGSNAHIVYIGDGTPTWGKTHHKDLLAALHRKTRTPVYAALLGRGASTQLWNTLTGRSGGKVFRPHTRTQARKAAFFIARASSVPKVENFIAQEVEGLRVFPNEPQTLFAGDAMTLVVRAPRGKMPSQLSIGGKQGPKVFSQNVVLATSTEHSALVAQRWASREIYRLQESDGSKEDIVALSRDFGVLSKHTSLLVLESEEAYREHQIERRKAVNERLLAQNTPVVSGQDLDNLDGRQASLSPDHIQPGDPEVRIPAPADARSVVLVFPFGDTKLAHYDAESQNWVARFLIDPDTEDGRYWVRVTIEHASGELEEMRLPYTVDTSPPNVSLKVVKLGGNRFRVFADQEVVGDGDASPQALDAARVEVLLPWGQTHRLYRKEMGRFSKTLRAPIVLGTTIRLRLVVTDQALNQRVLEIDVPVERP